MVDSVNTCKQCGNLFSGSVCPTCGFPSNSAVQPSKQTSSCVCTDYVCHNCCSSSLHMRVIKGLGVLVFLAWVVLGCAVGWLIYDSLGALLGLLIGFPMGIASLIPLATKSILIATCSDCGAKFSIEESSSRRTVRVVRIIRAGRR